MNEEKYTDYSTEEFVLDNDFRTWVLQPDKASRLFWEFYLRKYPDRQASIAEAKLIVRSLVPVKPDIQGRRLQFIFQNIKHDQRKRILRSWGKLPQALQLLLRSGPSLGLCLPEIIHSFLIKTF